MDVAANIPLLKNLLPLIVTVHLAWLGMMAGAATVAVALDALGAPDRHRAIAVAILTRVAIGLPATALLGATATLILLDAQLVYPLLPQSARFRAATLLPLLAGLALLALYRRLLRQGRGIWLRPGLGLAGTAMLLFSSFLLCCGSGLLVMPEKWPFLAAMPLLFLSWVGSARFLEFTCLALAATGGVVMLAGERTTGAEEARFARRLGGGLALLSILAWPASLLFGLFNLSDIALSGGVWLLAAASLALALSIALLLPGALVQPKRRHAGSILALCVALIASWVVSDHLARENALDESTLAGLSAPVRAPARGKAPPAAGKVAAGKEVFERLCVVCHRFDAKLVGPPLDVVLPKYRRDPEALRAFIRNPAKRDPAYPAMPKLPLTDAEIDAVAAYLLEGGRP